MWNVEYESFSGEHVVVYRSRWRWLAIRKFKKYACSFRTLNRWFLKRDGSVVFDFCKVYPFQSNDAPYKVEPNTLRLGYCLGPRQPFQR